MVRIPFAVLSLVAVATATQPSCNDFGGELGVPPHEARRHADDTLGAIAGRFGPTVKSKSLFIGSAFVFSRNEPLILGVSILVHQRARYV